MSDLNNTETVQVVEFEVLPTGKPHVSFSEIREWSECSWRHRLRHIDKIDINVPSIHASFGKAVHAYLENYVKTKTPNKQLYDNEFNKMWDDLNSEIDKTLEAIRLKHEGCIPVETLDGRAACALLASKKQLSDKARDDWYNQGLKLIEEAPKFLDEQFPGWELLSAEFNLYEPVDNHNISFKGFIDLVIKAKGARNKDVIWIIDYKTTSFGWKLDKKQDPMTRAQLVYYKHFWSKKMGVSPKDVRCGFILLKRTAKDGNRCELVPVSVGDVTTERSLKVMNNMVTSVKKGIAIKNRESCQYCNFKDTSHCI